ncbi:hypothetical protein [Bartonella tamiae]|uniref:hypothetical protein n=1 Tax=Bartonella tamiae TaxID=373638 RepID=UPI00026E77A6|nr:hypothetical protein [Bartonella tamiae]EJF92645.1 hypothetical protein MEG_01815 [Bartonella tamiae Th307]
MNILSDLLSGAIAGNQTKNLISELFSSGKNLSNSLMQQPVGNSVQQTPLQQQPQLQEQLQQEPILPAQLQREQEPQTQVSNINPKKKGSGVNNFLDRLADVASGWASGRTVSESLGLGGVYAQKGLQAQRTQNQTIDYLMRQGFNEDDAKSLANNPSALSQALANINKGTDPTEALKAQKLQLEIAKTQREIDTPNLIKVGEGNLYNPETKEWVNNPNAQVGASEYGLTPQYGVDENGNPILIQVGKNGEAIQTKMPDGVRLQKEPIRIDAGTHTILLDPITRQQIGMIDKNIAEAKAQETIGKSQGDAQVALPATIQSFDTTIDNVKALASHEGLNEVFGQWNQYRPSNLMSDKGRDALARYDQIKGQAFLQGFQALKGGGAITEIEGKKAEESLLRMSRAQDPETFKTALNDFLSVLEAGRARAYQSANVKDNGGEINQNTPQKIVSKEDFEKLPSGTTFVAPDGSTRVKP